MMNKKLFLLIVLLGVTGCKTPAPTQYENFFEAATQSASFNSTTESAIYPTASSEPLKAIEAEVVFRDDFDSVLNSEWTVVNQNADNWDLSIRPGFLKIDAVGGYFSLKNASNVLLYPAPQGAFMIETSFLFDPEMSDQFAGLIAAESNDNFVQAGIGFCLASVGCSGRGFNIDIYLDGKLTLPRNTTSASDELIFARLIFKNDTIYVFNSADGTTWYRIFERKFEFEMRQVGLIAAQNNDIDPETAFFDYFEISTITP